MLLLPQPAGADVLPAGSRDPGFGTGGIATTSVDSSGFADVQIYEGGPLADKLLAVGHVVRSGGTELLIARFNPDGSLDPGFDGDGIVILPVAGGGAYPAKVDLDQAGRILVVIPEGSIHDGILARFNPDGSPDDGGGAPTAGFGSCGCGYVDVPGITDVAVDRSGPDRGEILYSGTAAISDGSEAIAGRLADDGDQIWERGLSMDSTPDHPEPGWDDSATAVAEDANGNVVVAGLHERWVGTSPWRADRRFGIVRLTPGGELDIGFGSGGGISQPVGSQSTFAETNELALDDSGRFLISGFTSPPASGLGAALIVRLTEAGALDSSFAGDGIHSRSDGGLFGDLQADDAGRVVAAGIVDHVDQYLSNAGAVRLTADGAPDIAFGDDGVARLVDDPQPYTRSGAWGMDLDDRGVVIAGSSDQGAILVRFLSEESETDGDDGDDGGDGGDDGGNSGAVDDAGEVAGGVGGQRIRVHKLQVPRTMRKLLRVGVRALASCKHDCRMVLEIRVKPAIAARMGLSKTLIARGARRVGAERKGWILARPKGAARRALSSYSGGGRFKVTVRAQGVAGRSVAYRAIEG